ncbi:hypothetical protein TOPH_07157 [Tolypocladium ophioglossoides CBS 100239]|uniref:Uncharacterized protein n=1 Tax=Tolypocladium ophioglossoides (strain CBS 100239) TaxID=1163406 RepID=A0A0L0N2A1_TOLOC|nr:hypothetical protein TOPH_07157 [Tolypocladium ophioglossoides CBS 100239]
MRRGHREQRPWEQGIKDRPCRRHEILASSVRLGHLAAFETKDESRDFTHLLWSTYNGARLFSGKQAPRSININQQATSCPQRWVCSCTPSRDRWLPDSGINTATSRPDVVTKIEYVRGGARTPGPFQVGRAGAGLDIADASRIQPHDPVASCWTQLRRGEGRTSRFFAARLMKGTRCSTGITSRSAAAPHRCFWGSLRTQLSACWLSGPTLSERRRY